MLNNKFFACTIDLFVEQQTIYLCNSNSMEVFCKLPLKDIAYDLVDLCYDNFVFEIKMVSSSTYAKYLKEVIEDINSEKPTSIYQEIKIEIYEV